MPPPAPEPDPTDPQLVARANRGEPQAFELLYRRHQGWVLTMATRVTGNSDDAMDVLQETFAYFFGKFPGFVLTATVRGFLFPVVRTKGINVLRRRQKVVALDDVRGESSPSAPLRWHPDETASDFERLIHTLPEGQRQVVLLRFGLGFRLPEIAEALGIPVGTVKSRMHQALASLRAREDLPEG